MSTFDFHLYKEQHQSYNNLIYSLYFQFQKWTRQHKTIARISATRTMRQLGQVRFNTALFMVRPTEILLNFTTESKLGAKEKIMSLVTINCVPFIGPQHFKQ